MNQMMEKDRESRIVRASVIGILTNLLLAGFKAVLGALSHSIAIVMDAVNNISDAASSVITIIGTRLAAKEPDIKHPFGYGRIEYLSAMIISVIVLYAGITSLVESLKQILHPETPDYSTVSLIIVAVAVVVKILLGRYVKHVGEAVHDDAAADELEHAHGDHHQQQRRAAVDGEVSHIQDGRDRRRQPAGGAQHRAPGDAARGAALGKRLRRHGFGGRRRLRLRLWLRFD